MSEQILQAAFTMFSRYGVNKTTMADIAREAGVARQTVYNAYPGKSEILRATVRMISEQALRSVTEAWGNADSLAEKLDIFFEMGPLAWYDMLHDAPDSADLIDGVHVVAGQEMAEANEKWVAVFEAMFTAEAGLTDIKPAALADYVYHTGINAKAGAQSRDLVKARLDVLRASTLALLGAAKSD